MKLPRWMTAIGLFECLLGAWGIYMALEIGLAGFGIRRWVTAVAVAILGGVSVWSGSLLLRRDPRGVGPSVVVFALQSVRFVAPGIAWVVALGLSFNLVLYEGVGAVPDGPEVVMYIGNHARPGLLALNLVALVPAVILALWRRAAVVATERAPSQASAS